MLIFVLKKNYRLISSISLTILLKKKINSRYEEKQIITSYSDSILAEQKYNSLSKLGAKIKMEHLTNILSRKEIDYSPDK